MDGQHTRFEPRFRVHERTASGYEIYILGHQFDTTGPLHFFNDHRHAHNFCRYLFSLTKAHPENHLTPRNVVSEYLDGKVLGNSLQKPQQQFADFMKRRFPLTDADVKLCDDGAYVGFAVKMPDNHIVSNFCETKDGDLFINLSVFEMLRGTQQDVDAVSEIFEKGDDATCFDEVAPDARTLAADRIVQRLVSRQIGGDPLMTVSHRDQLDHNQTYHIHRLLHRA